METALKVSNYQEYKETLDNQLKETAEGFVRIGYLLKLARDTDILAGSGYTNVNEFAKAEYNMDKSMVSRFININTKFAENGCSEYLKEQYRGFGYAKLVIMLQLPEAINEELTPDFTKSEIQAIKEEVDEEKKVSDIEILLEGENEQQKVLENNLDKVLHQLGEDEPELFVRLFNCYRTRVGLEAVQEELAPSGSQIYSVRIQGVGRNMLSLQSESNEIVVINVRYNVKETYTWEDLYHSLERLTNAFIYVDGETAWKEIYQKEFPKKEEVAPVQPEEKRPPNKKVTKAKKPSKEKKDEHREKVTEKSTPVQEDSPTESESNDAAHEGETEHCREEMGGIEDKAPEESLGENNDTAQEAVIVEVVPGIAAAIVDIEKAQAAVKENELRGEILAVPEHTREEPIEVITDAEIVDTPTIASENDITFNERIQTAECILIAVKRDNKSEARRYCHELLRLFRDYE